MPEIIKDLEQVQQLAESRQDAFEVMRYQLEFDDDLSDEVIDAAVDELAQAVTQAIDCKECGNCCRVMTVHIYPEDVPRLAQGTLIPIESIRENLISQPPDLPEDVWGQFRASPCSFLKGTVCSIYEHRPEACRDFPTFTPDFRWTLDYLILQARICPIVYNVLEGMVSKTDDLQRKL